MFQIDPLSLIPRSTKEAVLNALVDVVAGQAGKLLGEPAAGQVRKLRSDAAFRRSYDEGLARALRRFQAEYEEQDEDLVQALLAEPGLFKDPLVQQALLKLVQNPGRALEAEREAVAQSFAGVLAGRKNRARVDRAVGWLLKCLAEELWTLPEIRPIYEALYLRISAEEARKQTGLQAAQLAALERLNAGIQEALMQLTQAVTTQKQLPAGQAAALPPGPKARHNLPGRSYGRFIGREKELAEVFRLLHPAARHFLITIDGIGGIGKSTLALEVAHQFLRRYERIPPAERFEAIIWTSARQSVLTADGVQERPQVLRVLEDIYKTIAITLGREDIPKAPLEEQAGLVCAALTRQRTLLIVDNLETVDDERVISFLRELPEPTKAIVTTRHRIDVAYPIRLREMDPGEAAAYITQESARRKLAPDETQRERLYRLTGGVPLAINWSLALAGKGVPFEEVFRRLGDAGGSDIAAYCFRSSVDQVRGRPAYWLMLALAFFNPDGGREALGQVADLSRVERDDGLAELVALSLANHTGSRFSFLPITRSFAIAELRRQADFHLQAGRRWLDYLKGTVRLDVNFVRRYLISEADIREGPNLLDAIEWAYQYGAAQDVFELTRIALEYLDHQGMWNEIEYYVGRGLELARSTGNQRYVAWFCDGFAWLYEQRGDFEAFRPMAEEALALYRASGDLYGQVTILMKLAGWQRKTGHFDRAREFCDQARALCETAQDGDLLAEVESGYGKLARDMHDWDAAWAHFSAVRDWFQKRTEQSPVDESLARGAWGQLAFVALHLGRPQEARDLIQRSLEYFQNYGTQGYLATLLYRLALAEEALGERAEALAHAREALGLFERLGMQPDRAEAEGLVGRLG